MQTALLQVSAYFRARDLQKRPHNVSRFGRNAGHSGDTGAAQHIQHRGFYIVFAVMAYGDGNGVVTDAKLLEPSVAKAATSHFDTFARALAVGFGVEIYDPAFGCEVVSYGYGVITVAQRFVTAQIEVAVCSYTFVAQS